MHRILSLLLMLLFLLEEILHQKLGKAGRLSPVVKSNSIVENYFDRFDLLRLFELLFMGLILSTAEGSAATGHGQLTLILTGLQMARLFGRRVLSRWSVLGVLQVLQMVLLITVILVPFKYTEVYAPAPLPLLALLCGIFYAVSATITTAFSISYGVRLRAKEFGNLYETFPPLVSSEGWAYKFSTFSLYTGTVGGITLIYICGLSPLTVFFFISILLQLTGSLLCKKDTFTGHHPWSHILWGTSFLILYLLAVTKATTIQPPL